MKKVIRLTESDLMRIVKRVINENIDVIDRILDKVGEYGIGSLSKSEKDILDRYSEWTKSGKSPVDFTWDEDETQSAYEVKYSDDGDYRLKFKFKKGEILSDGTSIIFFSNEKPRKFGKDEVMFNGEIIFDNVEYVGHYTIKNGDVKSIDFTPNDNEYDEDDFTIQFEQDTLLHKINEMGLLDEVKIFLTKCADRMFK